MGFLSFDFFAKFIKPEKIPWGIPFFGRPGSQVSFRLQMPDFRLIERLDRTVHFIMHFGKAEYGLPAIAEHGTISNNDITVA